MSLNTPMGTIVPTIPVDQLVALEQASQFRKKGVNLDKVDAHKKTIPVKGVKKTLKA